MKESAESSSPRIVHPAEDTATCLWIACNLHPDGDVFMSAEFIEQNLRGIGVPGDGSQDGFVMSDPGPSVQGCEVLSGLRCIRFVQKDFVIAGRKGNPNHDREDNPQGHRCPRASP